MSTPVVRPEVAEFVRAVRAHLDDLAPDEVEELTGGLEADLADALDESAAAGDAEGAGAAARGPAAADRFGDPAVYAAELRSAAGLPPRVEPGGRRGSGLAGALGAASGSVLEGLRQAVEPLVRQPWWPGVRDFAVTLRPAWWVARAWVAFQVVYGIVSGRRGVLPVSFQTWFALAGLVIVSVEVGRRGIARRTGWTRALIGVGNVIAVPLMLAFVASLSDGALLEQTSIEMQTPPGFWVDGTEVTNVFPYDAQGRPLTGVQLYDQDGRPLGVPHSEMPQDSGTTWVGADGGTVLAPAIDDRGQPRFNVFPLREATPEREGEAIPTPTLPPPPLVAVPPLITPRDGSPTESATPTAAQAPTVDSTATAVPTATATSAPSATVSPTP